MSRGERLRTCLRTLVSLSLMLLAATPVSAAVIAADDFEGYTPGSVDGAIGGSGWSGAWQGAGAAVASVVDTSGDELTYRSPAGEAVLGAARALAFTGNNDQAALRNLTAAVQPQDVYVSMLVRFTGTQQANDFLALWFENSGFGAAPNIGVKMNDGDNSSPRDLFARTQASNHVSVQDIVAGETYFLVGHLSKPNNGRNTVFDRFRLWVNPASLATEPAEDAVSTGNSSITGFSRIGFRAVNLDAGDTVVIDRLRIGTTWQDVAEPDIAPVLSLRMDETEWLGSAGEVTDSAAGFDGTALGGVTTVNLDPALPGDPGTCRYGSFDGNDDHVLVPHDATLNGSSSLTYMAWVRPSSWSGVRQIMAKSVHGGGAGRAQMGLFSEGSVLKVRAEAAAGRFETSSALPPLDTWTHVAGVFAGDHLDLYVNGTLAASTTFAATTLVQTSDPLAISKRVGSSQYFFAGGIDEVRVYQEALDQSDVQAAMNDTRPCAAEPFLAASAFRIDHDGAGIHCLDEPLQVTVLDASGKVLVDYAGDVTLATDSGRGGWGLLAGNGALADPVADDGAAVYRFTPADAGVATFALAYPEGASPVNVDAYEVADPTIRDTDAEGPLVFAPSGFTVTASALANPPPSPVSDPLPPAVAGTAFDVHLTAYGVTDDDPQCGVIESYGGSRDLTFATSYVNPTSGSRLALVDGVAADGVTSTSVDFSAGQAVVSARYKDAGSIRLQVRDPASFDQPLDGGSNAFVVRPATLVVTRIQSQAGDDNPGTTTPTGDAFAAAGDAFDVDVEARDADGDLTANYGRETPAQGVRVTSDALLLPAGGRNGSTGDVQNGSAFTPTATAGRFVNDQVVFDEVGVIRLRPAVDDDDYLGAGAVPGTLTGPVGRFHAAAFQVIGDTVTAACGAFTYMDQPALQLGFVLQALNVAGGVTENYDRALLGDPDAVADFAVAAEAADDGVDRAARLSALGGDWVSGEVEVDLADVAFARLAGPDGPFDDLQLALIVNDGLDAAPLLGLDLRPDTSGDCLAPGNCTAHALGAPTGMVYGRLAVLPAAGPENEDLDVPLRAQIYTGAAFESHSADSCTTYSAADASLSGYTGNLEDGMTAVVAPAGTASLISGAADATDPLRLSAPGFGHDGTVDLSLDVPPWLQFDWHGTGLEDPTATAAFGRFRGHDRIIFRGEQR